MELPSKPEHINNLEFIRILTPYVFTHRIVKDKSVLDIGCGLGHGTWLFVVNDAEQVITIDLDKTKTLQVHGFCSKFKNCSTLVMDAQKLGFKDRSIQVVTCFEVIEHILKPDLLLSEIKRILKPDGVLFLTTPNRAKRLLPFQRPWNREHLREYTSRTFRKSLQNHFPSFELLGIYGEPPLHEHYKNIWKQNFVHFYFGVITPIIRRHMPKMVKRWIINQLGDANQKGSAIPHGDSLNRVVPVTDPENWPFYVSDLDVDCLNFFVICSFDGHIVQRSIAEIKRPL